MPQLVVANTTVGVPMGAQVYEEAIAARAATALGPDWQVERMVTRSMRSPLPGTHRVPATRLGRAPGIVRRLAGQALYPRGAVVHRMNLELPPAPLEVVTLHDVVAWKYPDESPPVRAALHEVRRAAAVICVSSYTAQEAVSFLGVTDPVVVPNGVDQRFVDAAPLDQAQLGDLGISGRFVLAGGGVSDRKNLRGLAEAWRVVSVARPELRLVLSGPEHPRRTELFAHLPRVRLVGRVPDMVMPGLVAAAAAVVIPSREEGFGLPALESMAARTPVVASDTSSLPEVVGDGGLLVPPTPAALAEGIIHATSGDDDIAARVERGYQRARLFSWERSAAGHAAVWRRVASEC